jgi:hypothetical protein
MRDLSRRGFLKAATAAVLAPRLIPAPSPAPSPVAPWVTIPHADASPVSPGFSFCIEYGNENWNRPTKSFQAWKFLGLEGIEDMENFDFFDFPMVPVEGNGDGFCQRQGRGRGWRAIRGLDVSLRRDPDRVCGWRGRVSPHLLVDRSRASSGPTPGHGDPPDPRLPGPDDGPAAGLRRGRRDPQGRPARGRGPGPRPARHRRGPARDVGRRDRRPGGGAGESAAVQDQGAVPREEGAGEAGDEQATGFSADDGVCLAIVATALVGLWFVFWRNP